MSRSCRDCRMYDRRSRWCSGAEEVVTNTEGGCRYYDGPEPEPEYDLQEELDREDRRSDRLLNESREESA
jgi:hypothetical protein